MKRILSLVLVLVMLIGVMPVALAEATCEHENWDAGSVTTAATCGTAGVMTYSCLEVVDGVLCTGSKTEAVAPVVAEGTACTWVDDPQSTDVAPTCTTEGKKTQKCSVCNDTQEVVVAATGHKDENSDNICDVESCKANLGYSVTAAADLDLLPGETGSAVPSVSPALPSDVTISYTSSDETVATVAAGVVTAVAAGEATIKATFTVGEKTYEATTKVKVSSVAITNVSDIQTAYSTSASVTLKPALSENIDNVTWKFEVTKSTADEAYGTNAAKDQFTIDPSKAGLVAVKITASWGETQSVSKEVYISFYDTVNAEVVVDDGVTAFMFDDLDVFATVKINNINMYQPKNYSMGHLWSGIDYENLLLLQKDSGSTVGELSYSANSVFNAYDPYKQNSYSKYQEDNLKFTCLSRGQFVLYYDLTLKGMVVRTGTITISVSEGGSDIKYNTTFTKPVTFEENDFEKLWNASKNKSKLDYVTFTSSAIVGDMYTDSTEKIIVSARQMFHNDYSTIYDNGTYDYDLDLVTYVPYAKAAKAYEDTITFTCVGEDTDETLSGVLVISVGEKVNFTDVKTTDYFYDAVVWAVNEGVTNGLSDTQFGPNATCTRAQVVTFLWRAAGEPEPTTSYMPFKDVEDDAYYYDAVLWAVEEDITTGTSSTTFSPNATVTRGQVVTFLWRAEGSETVRGVNPFKDVDADDYYYEAVLWAVENDITTGLSATQFGPNSGCTRGQIVTFLYRNYEED